MKELWKIYEEISGKYENKDSPSIWAVGLGKIPSSSSYLEGWGVGSQFPDLGVPQRKDMKNVKIKSIHVHKVSQT